MTTKTQYQMFLTEQKRIADIDQHFLDMVNDSINPLTNDDLKKLVKTYPERWGRYEGYIDSTMFKKIS